MRGLERKITAMKSRSSIGMKTREELRSTQEEAATGVFLHAAHAAAVGYRVVVITSEDTNVYLFSL